MSNSDLHQLVARIATLAEAYFNSEATELGPEGAQLLNDHQRVYVSAVPDEVFARLEAVWREDNAHSLMRRIIDDYREEAFFEDLSLEAQVLLEVRRDLLKKLE